MAKKKAKQKKRQTPVKKKRKILYGRIFLAIFLLAMMIVLIVVLVPKKIKNISVSGNQFLSDQEVIELAGLEDYPSTFTHFSFQIKQALEDDVFVKSATVSKSWLYDVHITIEENRPLFYDTTKQKTILESGYEADGSVDVPTLVN